MVGRLPLVPQGDELIVVEHVAYLSGVDRDQRRRHVLGTQELDDLAEPQFLLACILVGLRPQRTEVALGEVCRQRDGFCEAQEALEAKAKVTQAGDLPSLSGNFPCVHPVRSNNLVNDLASAWSRPMVTETSRN